MKNRAVDEITTISKIYEDELIKSRLSTESLAALPLVREIRMYIYLLIVCSPWHDNVSLI